MADEPFALSTALPELPAEAEYDAICAAVMSTVRGRWFLQEYSRRNHNTDTRAVLAAIERIESVIQGERAQQAQQHHRGELLEMARAIARTRAEVVEFKPEPAAHAHDHEAVSETASDAVAAAKRLQDVARAMRERGIDPLTSEQIEQLAATILSASALRNPGDRRAQKLAEVLQYLERRIGMMLDASADRAPEQSENMHAVAGAAAGGEDVVPDHAFSEAAGYERIAAGEGNAEFSGSESAQAVTPLETVAASAREEAEPEKAAEPEYSAVAVASAIETVAATAELSIEDDATPSARAAAAQPDTDSIVAENTGAAAFDVEAANDADEPPVAAIEEEAAQFAPQAEAVAAEAPAEATVSRDDEPLQIELEPLVPAVRSYAEMEPVATELDVPPLTVEALLEVIAASEAAAAETTKPTQGTPHSDQVQGVTTDIALDPPELAPIERMGDAPANAVEPEATVAAEVDSDLGFLAATADEAAAPDAAEVANERQPASAAAASEASPEEGPAVYTADRAMPEETSAAAVESAEPPPAAAEPARAVAVAPPHEGDLLVAVWESALSVKPVTPPAPTMWGDSDPSPGSPTAVLGRKPHPQPVAAADARASAQAPAPLPADFLLDPLSPPLSERAAPRFQALPASAVTGEVADIEGELFAAAEAPGPRVMSAAPALPATAAVTAAAPVASMVVVPAAVVATPVPAPPAQPAAAPAAAAPRPAVNDPLAALQVMSDEERIALFT